MLKENEPEGASWVNTLVANGITYTFTMVKKGLTKTVNGKEFTNVINVRLDYTIQYLGTPFPSPVPPFNYYYAKGVGLILTDMGTSGSTVLDNYSIK